jgi:hypothetical protein
MKLPHNCFWRVLKKDHMSSIVLVVYGYYHGIPDETVTFRESERSVRYNVPVIIINRTF